MILKGHDLGLRKISSKTISLFWKKETLRKPEIGRARYFRDVTSARAFVFLGGNVIIALQHYFIGKKS